MPKPTKSERTPEEHARAGLRRLAIATARTFTGYMLPTGITRHVEFLYPADADGIPPGAVVTVTVEIERDAYIDDSLIVAGSGDTEERP